MLSPILIDSRGLLKIISLSILVGFLVFVAGFISGYQRAQSQQIARGGPRPLALPVVAATEVTAPLTPPAPAPGADIDVDLPDGASRHSIEIEQAVVAPDMHPDEQPVTASNATRKTPPAVAAQAAVSESAAAPSAAAGTAKYTIQVGTYSRRSNAQKMVEALRAQGLAAYVTDYLNRRQQPRYNVRFGAYGSRRQARAVLAQYKTGADRDGYLVRYTAPAELPVAEGAAPTAVLKEDAPVPVPAAQPASRAEAALNRVGTVLAERREIN